MSSVKRWKTESSQILSDISKVAREIIEKLLGIKILLTSLLKCFPVQKIKNKEGNR